MAEVDQDTKWCSNCKRDIASSNFVMHEVHCRRNIVLCEECNEPISKAQHDEHYQEYHAPVTCELCNKQIPREMLQEHKENECPKRSSKCLFCELEMPAADLKEHQDFCGSRTELCTKCQQYIMYKDMSKHEKSNCSFPAAKSKRNDNSFDFMAGAGLQNGSSWRSGVNDFAVDEVNRMINGTTASIYHGAFQQNNFRTMASTGQSVAAPPGRTINDITPVDHKTGQGAVRKTTKKDMENSDREKQNRSQSNSNSHTNHNNNQEIDELLAFQLENEDAVTLPCEFCGQLFSIDILNDHQTFCRVQEFSNLSMNDEETLEMIPNNRTEQLLPTISNRRNPNIIDNVAYSAAVDELRNLDVNAVMAGSDSQDDTLLPCEYCDNLFPTEILIQHQAVCDVNKWYDSRRHASSYRARGNSVKNKQYSSSSSTTTRSLKNSLPDEDTGTYNVRGSSRNKSLTAARNNHSRPAIASQNQNKKAFNGLADEDQQTGEGIQSDVYMGRNHRTRGRSERYGRGASRGNTGSHFQVSTDRPARRGQGLRGASSNRQHTQRGSRTGLQQLYRDRAPPADQQLPAYSNGKHDDKSNSHDTYQLTAGRDTTSQSEFQRLSTESQAGGSTIRQNSNRYPPDMGITGSKARRSNKQRNNTDANGTEQHPAVRGQRHGRFRGQQRGQYRGSNY